MHRKSFPVKWIDWIKQTVEGGRVDININGELGGYFKTFKGLRQGDPLSPLLFNLVADALSELLLRAQERGRLRGVVPHLVRDGLVNLQYADDTILFMEYNDQNIVALKFLLYCFESMSGMKISYQKSEVFTVGVHREEAERVADKFNCKLGDFPLTYLGIPVSGSKPSVTDFKASRVWWISWKKDSLLGSVAIFPMGAELFLLILASALSRCIPWR
ncbi:hypothetical protein GUJ93_ZPchr0013g34123 [Zizania palustris]|uniref:Reverse transcriptase domain-containing protein n=1 Tax=Zizania palustris TaxID=103762 RepID=A0A8J5X1Z7_ZIZPA|nr:hypothetical protein GUJ93_ZPchr0013g34123 [Zizania palustris]